MTSNGSSAAVLGASMAGLITARVLSDHFDHVTIVERDHLPIDSANRKGVPQGNHAHGLLASGYRVMDGYFPGMMDDLEAAGAPRGDVVGDFLWYQYGHWKLRHQSGLRGITVSRPALEGEIRARVKAIPNVTVLEDHDGEHPAFDTGAKRVTGVVTRDRRTGAEETIAADLVVDTSGRGSQSPKWLQEWGFDPPPTATVRTDVGYGTRVLERNPGDFKDSMGGVIAGTAPESTRYAAVLAAEGPRWVVTLAGVCGDYPPGDEEGWLTWAKALPVPDVYDLCASATPLTDVMTYRFPANQRRYYEKMRRFPAGYLVLGDAICSFNPIYGQGMSAAALEAEALDQCLAAGSADLAPRFFKKSGKIADIPWTIATGEDFRYPQVPGKRPPMHGLINRYMDRVHRVAAYDPVVCRRFFDVANLQAPPQAVMAPPIMKRVFFSKAPTTGTEASRAPGTPGRV